MCTNLNYFISHFCHGLVFHIVKSLIQIWWAHNRFELTDLDYVQSNFIKKLDIFMRMHSDNTRDSNENFQNWLQISIFRPESPLVNLNEKSLKWCKATSMASQAHVRSQGLKHFISYDSLFSRWGTLNSGILILSLNLKVEICYFHYEL